jgi:hypothetical protein
MDKKFRLLIAIDAKEKELLDTVLRSFGGNASEYIRSLIRIDYKKAFPLYTQKAQEKAGIIRIIDPEQLCEQAGGKKGIDANGAKVCIFNNGHITGSVPFDQPEQFKPMAKRMGMLG